MNERLRQFFFSVVSLLAIASLVPAQSSQSTQPQTSQVAISATTGKEAVCEGGAEIIPSGQQSFARKRYTRVIPKAKPKMSRLKK